MEGSFTVAVVVVALPVDVVVMLSFLFCPKSHAANIVDSLVVVQHQNWFELKALLLVISICCSRA